MCLSFSMLDPLCELFPRIPWDSASLLGPLLLGRTCADGPYSSSGIGTTHRSGHHLLPVPLASLFGHSGKPI